MNLAYHYPSLYWATAVLTVEAGALDNDDGNGTNYAKVASAIGRIKAEGYNVELPDINEAQFGFTPDVDNNTIIYGLKGISEVGDDFARQIIELRPYNSVEDFIIRCQPAKKQMINLIKGGAFNKFDDRIKIMENYLCDICPKKARITLQNMNTLIDYRLIPEDLSSYIHLYNFNKYIKKSETPEGLRIDARAAQFLAKNYPDIDFTSGWIDSKVWKKTYERDMGNLKEWLKDNEEELKEGIQHREVKEIWNKYCTGSISAWEMDVLGFYYSPHELATAWTEGLVSSNTLPEGDFKHLSLIDGTVLGKNAYKHMVTILTPTEVVDLKFTGEQFAQYNKTISEIINGEKKTLERSWFTKGVLLLVKGYKTGETFRVRELSRIIEVNEDGSIRSTRYRYGEGW